MHVTSSELFNGRVLLQRDLTSRDIAIAHWVQMAAGKGTVPYDRVYDADIAYGHCLVGLDGCRMHLDWYINTLPFSPIPERYNEDISMMVAVLDSCQRTTIHAETELARIESVIQQQLHPQPEAHSPKWRRVLPFLRRLAGKSTTPYRFPFLPLKFKTTGGQKLPEILINYHYIHAALTGFSGQVIFWYSEQNSSQMPVGFGTPGQRLAIIMPAVMSQ